MNGEEILTANGGAGPSLEARFASLEDASRSLSADVQALTATISVVNELQIRQRKQEVAQVETEKKVEAARRLAVERTSRINRVITFMATIFAILVPAVTILVYASLISHVNTMINDNNRSAYNSCSMRNRAALENAAREDALAGYESDARIATIHTKSAEQLRNSLSNCDAWLEKNR